MTEKYSPKLFSLFTAIYLASVFVGVFFLYANSNEITLVDRYIPSIFLVYGILMLIKTLRTKYILDNNQLIIHSGSKQYAIDYEKIIHLQRRKINPSYKYGSLAKIIRAETATDVLLITFSENHSTKRIMISPKNMERFVIEINVKIAQANAAANQKRRYD